MSDILQSLENLRKQRSPEAAVPAATGLERTPVPAAVAAGEGLSGLDPVPGPRAEADPGTAASPADAAPPAGQIDTSSPLARGEEKTMAARVPLALHRELNRGLLDAADELQVRRVQLDEALEAAVRTVLRDAKVRQQWLAEIQQVRRERREG